MLNVNMSFRETAREMNAQATVGAFAASVLLKLPMEDWTDVLDHEPSWACVGSFEALLDVAHDTLDVNPSRSLDITRFVIEQFDRVQVDESLAVMRHRVWGMAWKERANACWSTGQFAEARRAITRALEIFSGEPYQLDRAVATLVLAMIVQRMGDSEAAVRLLDDCEPVFRQSCALRHELQALQLRAMFFFDAKRYDEALSTWLRAEVIAETLEEACDAARIQNNLGRCALEMNNLAIARHYAQLAIDRFTTLGMSAELARVQVLLAKIDERCGRPLTAEERRRTCEEEFRKLGMHWEADCAGGRVS